MKFNCAACGQHISYEESDFGNTGKCPTCNAPVKVPTAEERRLEAIRAQKLVNVLIAPDGATVAEEDAVADEMASRAQAEYYFQRIVAEVEEEKRSSMPRKIIGGITSVTATLLMFGIPVLIIFFFIYRIPLVDRIYAWSLLATFWSGLVILPLSLGLLILRATRPFASLGFLFLSIVSGFTLWIFCVGYCFDFSFLMTVFGLLFVGIGVLPLALLLMLFHAQWSMLFSTLAMFAIVIGFRITATTFGYRPA